MTHVVDIIDLTRRFKKRKTYHELIRHPLRTEWFTALNQVNLKVKKGEVYGLLGPNGAGKTTLIKILCTLILPSAGQAFVNGYDVIRHGKEVRRAFGYVISEERSFYWRLTARQNLYFFATLNNLPDKVARRKLQQALELVGLAERADIPFYSFSTGMRQRLAIARSLLTDPQVIFMDEPTRSLDPPAAQTLRKFVKERLVEAEGKTVFLATHIMEEAEYLCDRIGILNKGQILASGTVSEIRRTINKRLVYSLGLHSMPDGLFNKLRQVEGVVNIEAMPSPFTRQEVYFRVEVEDNGHAVIPNLINTVVQTGGQVAACTPVEQPLGEVLTQVLGGQPSS